MKGKYILSLAGGMILAMVFLPGFSNAFQGPGLFNNLEEELVIRERGEWVIGQAGDIHADSSGYIYISDHHFQHIKVFSPEGELLRSIGRQGRGPGEFQDMVSVDLWNGQLLVLDRTGHRVSWLSAGTGELLDEFTFRPQDLGGSDGTPYKVLALGDNLAGIVFSTPARTANPDGEHPDFLVTYSRHGEVRSAPLLTGKGAEVLAMKPSPNSLRVIPRPFGRESLFRRGSDGSVYYGWTGELLIRRYHPRTGKPAGYVEQEFKPSPILPRQVDSVRKAYPIPGFPEVLEANLHTHWPALEQFVVDEQDRVWVQFRGGDRQYRNLWAFDRSNGVANVIDHDVRGRVSLVRYGKVYTLQQEGNGRPVIRRFGIVKALN